MPHSGGNHDVTEQWITCLRAVEHKELDLCGLAKAKYQTAVRTRWTEPFENALLGAECVYLDPCLSGK